MESKKIMMYDDRRALLGAQIGQLKAKVNLLDAQIEKNDKMFERVMNALVLKE